MEKQEKSSETLKKTTTQETVGSNFTRHLEETENIKEIRGIFQFMVKELVGKPKKTYHNNSNSEITHIKVDDFINFYKLIPLKLWATRPIFYYRKEKFDGLGMIGERIHQFTLKSKTLELYFDDCIGIRLTAVLDNDEELFKDITNPKDRLIEALYYLKENTTDRDLKIAYKKAKNILNGRYY